MSLKLKELLLNAITGNSNGFDILELNDKLLIASFGMANPGCYNTQCPGDMPNNQCRNSSCTGGNNSGCQNSNCNIK